MSDRRIELGQENIPRLLIKYSVPATIGMVVNSLYNIVDTIFIGKGAGVDALAAIAVCFPIQIVVLGIGQLVGLGAASIISRRLGAGDSKVAAQVAGTSFTVITVFSILLTVVSLSFLDPILRLFSASDTVLPYARDYLSVIMVGNFFFAFAVCASSVARAEGNIKVAMYSMILGAVANAVMDPIFIFDFGFGMGIKGAAVSTVLANILSFVFLVRYYLSGKSMLEIRRKYLIPAVRFLPEMLAVGSSSFFRTIAGSLVAIVVNYAIIKHGTDSHLAVFAIANRVMIFVLMPLFGLVQGLQPIIGFNYGARNFERVKDALNRAIRISLVYCMVIYLFLIVFTAATLSLFTDNKSLVELGIPIFRITLLLLPLIGIQVIGASLFQSTGKAAIALLLSMSRQVLFLVPLVLIMPRFFGLDGVWYAMPIADTLALAVTIIWVIRERRIFDKLTVVPTEPGS